MGEQLALANAESRKVQMTVESVLAEARLRTGLDDFGPRDFEERLAVMLEIVDGHPYVTQWGRAGFFDRAVSQVANRAEILDLFRIHPEIAEEHLVRPVFIVGMPRTGTTDLLNTIAADDRWRTLPRWEAHRPVPLDYRRARARSDGVDPRLSHALGEYREYLSSDVLPYQELFHPVHPLFIDEESEFEFLDFSLKRGPVVWDREMPDWRDHWESWQAFRHDWPTYTWLHMGLQILQWSERRSRFLGKAIMHMQNLGPLMEHYPDATIVFTHRDPVAVVQSAATFVCYCARMSYSQLLPSWYIDFYKEFTHRCLQGYLSTRALIPERQIVDVRFEDVRRDKLAIVRQIYQAAGMPMSEEGWTTIRDQSHERERGFVPMDRGRVVYNLREDFGVNPDELRSEFDYYLNGITISEEVK